MSAENFQRIENEKICNSIIKRDFFKLYHQQGAQTDDENQIHKFLFVENHNYTEKTSGYLDFLRLVRAILMEIHSLSLLIIPMKSLH